MTQEKRGLFITVEGPDGAGKSTQINYIKKYFEERGERALFTREPGGTKISEKIRTLILDKTNENMSYMTEALLYAAARAQLVEEVIEPTLAAGNHVICDRFIDSSIAYQGYGRGLGMSVGIINGFAVGNCMPDLTILLKLDSDRGMDRIDSEGSKVRPKDRLESESMDFHREVYKGYLQLERDFPERIRSIDAGQSIEQVSDDIKAELDRLFEERNR